MDDRIREILLQLLDENEIHQSSSILEEAARRLKENKIVFTDAVLLDHWHDLYRDGIICWGSNLLNPESPFFHVTPKGRQALVEVSRNPANPAGYLAYLDSVCEFDAITRSYVEEALATYNVGRHRSAAVMLGAAAECLVLQLRDMLLQYPALTVKKLALTDWKIKIVRDSLTKEFEVFINQKKMPQELAGRFQVHWQTFSELYRRARNDAGHPASLNPVEREDVHANLLTFPHFAGVVQDLQNWLKSLLPII